MEILNAGLEQAHIINELRERVHQLEAENKALLNALILASTRADRAEAVVAKVPQTIWENIVDELEALGGE